MLRMTGEMKEILLFAQSFLVILSERSESKDPHRILKEILRFAQNDRRNEGDSSLCSE